MLKETHSAPEARIEYPSELDFTLGDRLVQWFIERNWSPLQVGLVIYALALLSSFLIALFAGTLIPAPDSNRTALLADEFYLISETIMLPVVWGYYLWITTAPTKVITSLQTAGVLSARSQDIDRAKKTLSNRWLTGVAVLLAFAAAAVYYTQYADFSPLVWYNSSLFFVFIRSAVVILPTAFAGCALILRGVTNVLVFRDILKGVRVNPLHPDRAGGLLPLGQYALKTTYIIALAGIVAALAEYRAIQNGTFATATFFHLAIVVYIIAAPISFFAPLGTARSAMQEAKNRLILRISTQFNQDFSSAYGELEGSVDKLKESLEKIEQLQKMQKLTESFPIWPFDVETIRRFTLAITSPLVAIALSILSDFLARLILD